MSAPDRTSAAAASTGLDEMGPVDYLVLEFTDDGMRGEGLPLLLDIVNRGIIRIIDLELVRLEPGGTLVRLAIENLGPDADPALSAFAGAGAGLLGRDDLDHAAAVLEPGTTAVILVYENLWAVPLARALRRSGAQLVDGGRIPVQALLAALDAAETTG